MKLSSSVKEDFLPPPPFCLTKTKISCIPLAVVLKLQKVKKNSGFLMCNVLFFQNYSDVKLQTLFVVGRGVLSES